MGNAIKIQDQKNESKSEHPESEKRMVSSGSDPSEHSAICTSIRHSTQNRTKQMGEIHNYPVRD